ncbi:cell division ATP-binding protein FtsE [Helicobacter anatolicus]|uniref:cell division ATP-binding protein FtsE n=1 Tax=Helicobacter anatolicus TaxID=2905874 RepID=UPI001E3AD7AC|nr:ABC transporter ATP-binding protein [Helicobacter anatolicus]MCE3037801.1 ABC transporter ATP-binding protein [Helicobacter anatolicus]
MTQIIKASHLCLGYKKNENIIKDANFCINKKDFVFISGASGSGKSTLLRSLYGDLKISSGELEVNYIPIHHATKGQIAALRRHTGIVFQDYKLIEEWDIEHNIMLPMLINGYNKNLCKSQAKELLSHINLLHKNNKYPLELSGGEQQRVAIARAISHKPDIILADEPTGNLDDYSSELIWSLLKSANKHLGITIIVVTHRIPEHLNIFYRKLNIQEGEVYEFS